ISTYFLSSIEETPQRTETRNCRRRLTRFAVTSGGNRYESRSYIDRTERRISSPRHVRDVPRSQGQYPTALNLTLQARSRQKERVLGSFFADKSLPIDGVSDAADAIAWQCCRFLPPIKST